MTAETKPTPGAIRAAESIVGAKEGNLFGFIIGNGGPLSIQDLAQIIDRETAAPELIAGCKEFLDAIEAEVNLKCWAVAQANQTMAKLALRLNREGRK